MIPWIFFTLAITAALTALMTALLARRATALGLLALGAALTAAGSTGLDGTWSGVLFVTADAAAAVLAALAVGLRATREETGAER